MNAVERLWNARSSGDWDSIQAQLEGKVRIRLRHEDRDLHRDEYLAMLHDIHREGTTIVERIVGGGVLGFAVLANVVRADAVVCCAGFYELRQGLIGVIDETWIIPGSGRFAASY